MIAKNSTRVADHTADSVNKKIRNETITRINNIGHDEDKISSRLKELETEWDIERAIEANASTLILAGLGLGVFASRKWFVLPIAVAGFLFQHSIQGWCPPVPVLRRLGFRTQQEIDHEKIILMSRRENLADAMKDPQIALSKLEMH